jgi:hypothetical protein
MKAPRFSIVGMMGLVLVLAVGMVGLREGTYWWGYAAALITLLALLRATVNAGFRARNQRPFWAGFALCGWVYLALNWGAWSSATATNFPLPTQWALGALHPKIHPIPEYLPDQDEVADYSVALLRVGGQPRLKPGSPPEWKGNFDSYSQVGHSLAALVFASLGGAWAWWAFARREQPEERSVHTESVRLQSDQN